MTDGVQFTMGAAERISKGLKRIEELSRTVHNYRRNSVGGHRGLCEGEVLDTLDVADNSLNGQTCTRVRLFVFKQDQDSVALCDQEVELATSDDEIITVINRSLDLSLEPGTYVICGVINLGWRIIWADCTPSGGGGGGGGGGTTTTTGGGGVYGSTPYGGGGGTYGF